MDTTRDLQLLLASRYPLVLAEVGDEPRFMAVLRKAAAGAGLAVWTWSVTDGLTRDGGDAQYDTTDLTKALAFVAAAGPGAFVFADVHTWLEDARVLRRVKELAQATPRGVSLVLTAPAWQVRDELAGLAVVWTLRPPSPAELDVLLRRTIEHLSARGLTVDLDEAALAALSRALQGLSLREAEQLVQRAALEDGGLDAADVAHVRRAKAELLEAGGVLELIEADELTLDDVGGMERLKAWLELRGRALEPAAAAFGLEPPRGVLLTGVPGCGKSLVARALARTWGLPLVLLDPGRLYGAFVGESERRLRDALATIAAMAPVVLWLDEVEKGFAAGASDDGGVSRRVLGTFLRWLQDRPPGVFVVATCNDSASLPPELTRKGRFDETFFVGLPDRAQRAEILRVQLARRHRDPAGFDLDRLAGAGEGCSGAELEAAVVGALHHAYAAGTELTTEQVLGELAQTVPLSRSLSAGPPAAWEAGHAVPA